MMNDDKKIVKEWHTAHFISSVTSPEQVEFGLIILNQPIELDIKIFKKIWQNGDGVRVLSLKG